MFIYKGNDEAALQVAVDKMGPVSIAINVSSAAGGLSFYDKGVFSGKCSKVVKDSNHAVLIVGYTKGNHQA